MNATNVLVTGADGQLGSEFQVLYPHFRNLSIHHVNKTEMHWDQSLKLCIEELLRNG